MKYKKNQRILLTKANWKDHNTVAKIIDIYQVIYYDNKIGFIEEKYIQKSIVIKCPEYLK